MLKYVLPTLISLATSLAVYAGVYVLLFEFGDAATHDDLGKILQTTAVVVAISTVALGMAVITTGRSNIVGIVAAGLHAVLHAIMFLPLFAAYLGSLMDAAPDSLVYVAYPVCWIAMVFMPYALMAFTPRRWMLN